MPPTVQFRVSPVLSSQFGATFVGVGVGPGVGPGEGDAEVVKLIVQVSEPSELVAVIVIVPEPLLVGVPVIRLVDELKLSPAGSPLAL